MNDMTNFFESMDEANGINRRSLLKAVAAGGAMLLLVDLPRAAASNKAAGSTSASSMQSFKSDPAIG